VGKGTREGMRTLVGDVRGAQLGLEGEGRREERGRGLEGSEGVTEHGADEAIEFSKVDGALGQTTKGSEGQSLVVRCGDGVELECPEGTLGVADKELCLLAHLIVLRVEDRRQHLDPLETLLEFGKGRQVDVRGQEQAVCAD